MRFRKPTRYDTTTLNYNWQIWDTLAYSLYGGDDKSVDSEVSASVVYAMLNFMNEKGIIQFDHHRGYRSTVITDDDLIVVKSSDAGFFNCKVRVGDMVQKGQKIAEILDTGDGRVIREITSPVYVTVFFIQSNPMAFANGQLMLLVK